MATKAYQLIVRAGPVPGKIYPIMKPEVTIGRDPTAEILINDAEISRHHAAIKASPEGYLIEDLGSTNGTIINGQRIVGPHVLREGEMINLGEHIALIFEAQMDFDPDATMASARAAYEPAGTPLPPKQVLPPSNAPIPAYHSPATSPISERTELPQNVASLTTKKSTRWILFVVLGVIVLTCICVISVLAYIDANYLWCDIFPFIPGCLLPAEPGAFLISVVA
jgi:hypothetical protein